MRQRGHFLTFYKARWKALVSPPPARRKRLTNWLTLAGVPMASRCANQPFATPLVCFINAASVTFAGAEPDPFRLRPFKLPLGRSQAENYRWAEFAGRGPGADSSNRSSSLG